jgi:hypothetical protein
MEKTVGLVLSRGFEDKMSVGFHMPPGDFTVVPGTLVTRTGVDAVSEKRSGRVSGFTLALWRRTCVEHVQVDGLKRPGEDGRRDEGPERKNHLPSSSGRWPGAVAVRAKWLRHSSSERGRSD